jgi:hypothetical protein
MKADPRDEDLQQSQVATTMNYLVLLGRKDILLNMARKYPASVQSSQRTEKNIFWIRARTLRS